MTEGRLNRVREPRRSFWQDRTGHKVDLLLEREGNLLPMEIKAGQTVSPDFYRGLDFFATLTGLGEKGRNRGWVVYGGDLPREKGPWRVIPWRHLEETGEV